MAGNLLLVTFCNQAAASHFSFAVLDCETQRLNWVAHQPADNQYGSTGICNTPFGFLVAKQYRSSNSEGGQSSAIWVLDSDLNLIQKYACKSIRDVHSLLWTSSAALAVSSANNAVYELAFREDHTIKAERLFWALGETLKPTSEPIERDIYHINSIALHKGRLAVSMFGEGWRTISGNKVSYCQEGIGKVLYVDDGQVIMENLRHPHSLQSIDGELLVSESLEGCLTSESGERRYLDLYMRGIAWDSDYLYVGASAGRQLSKSTGLPSTLFGTERPPQASHIYVLDRKTFRPCRRIHTRFYGREIYDLCIPLHDIGQSKLEDNYFLRSVELETRSQELDSCHRNLAELERCKAKLAEAEARVLEMETSRSWRLTAPFRQWYSRLNRSRK